ncbi:hypothetical protein [Mesorhizobium shangrilense]|uniref:Tetratricopeptide repeat protein n=1 Tax=Mesorhizobium shangrilense TaxID=460060 RepID=A0ABV2DK21_9HYPH
MLIAATRTDGLGGRLLAMANAKSLADGLGCRFGFTWSEGAIQDNTFHIVDVVRKIFSDAFIEQYWLGERVDASRFGVLGQTIFTPRSLETTARQRNLEGWICDDFDVLKSFRADGAKTVRRSEALRGFGFSSNVTDAINAAGGVRFPGPMAALHLRSGDIVHGSYRTGLIFAGKVIPSTLAKAIVSELSARGLNTLLIGQDRETLEYLRSRTGALLISDLGVGEFEDRTLRDFFEMAVMARCQQIHAGSSIFATVASIMGDIPCLNSDALFSKARAAEIVLEELKAHERDYHPLEAAFGYQSAFLNLEDKISLAQTREILERALALDPENDIYVLKIVAAYFREGDFPSGEAVLKSLMSRQFQARAKIPLPAMRVLAEVVWDGKNAMSRNLGLFFAAAQAGHCHAMACSAYLLRESGEPRQAHEMAARLVEAQPANPMFRKIKRWIRLGRKPETGFLARTIWKLRQLRPF